MKWIGQHIYDLISRFRNDVYLEDVDTGTIASGGNLGLDSNNKIVKATVSSGSGDITGVDLTGTLPITISSETNTTSGDYSSTVGINHGNGLAVDGSGDLVIKDDEIDHDQLDNFAANEHFTQANITTVGTIGTGTWQGTAIATDQQKHLAYFDFKGYGTTDGTNYERQQIMTDNKAPFLHSLASGTDGLDDLEHYEVLRLGAHVMPRAGVLKKWQGWASSAGTGTINVSIVKVTPVANTTDDVTPVLVKNTQFTAVGNSKVIEIDETSFSVGFAEGDMLYTVVLGSTASKLWYLSSTVEVEWT